MDSLPCRQKPFWCYIRHGLFLNTPGDTSRASDHLMVHASIFSATQTFLLKQHACKLRACKVPWSHFAEMFLLLFTKMFSIQLYILFSVRSDALNLFDIFVKFVNVIASGNTSTNFVYVRNAVFAELFSTALFVCDYKSALFFKASCCHPS